MHKYGENTRGDKKEKEPMGERKREKEKTSESFRYRQEEITLRNRMEEQQREIRASQHLFQGQSIRGSV